MLDTLILGNDNVVSYAQCTRKTFPTRVTKIEIIESIAFSFSEVLRYDFFCFFFCRSHLQGYQLREHLYNIYIHAYSNDNNNYMAYNIIVIVVVIYIDVLHIIIAIIARRDR